MARLRFRWHRYRAARFLAWAIIIGALSTAEKPAYGQEADLRRAFLADYEGHGAKLLEYYSNVSIKFTHTYDMGNGESQVMEVESKMNSRNYLLTGISNRLIHEKTKEAKREFALNIQVRNPNYYFLLQKSPGKEFKLSDVKFPGPAFDFQTNSQFRFPFAKLSRLYLDLARNEKTRITQYQDAVWQNKKVKQITYENEYYDPGAKRNATAVVKCYFSPKNEWVCCGEDLGSDYKNIYWYERREKEEFPVPVRAEMLDGTRAIFTTVITEYRPMPPFGDGEFRLSAFGLPEPMGAPDRRYGGHTLVYLA